MVEDLVKEYYGRTLKSSDDLKTNACCTDIEYPPYLKAALANIHDEVMSRYYGCGICVPTQLEGLRVLDLGCGTGRDCYALAQLVGPKGSVVGIDMTKQQLDVAVKHRQWHMEKFGHAKSNVEFIESRIEDLPKLNFDEGFFDLVVSNCVINLLSDKSKLFGEVYRLLKPGGEMYFSDVYADRRVPRRLQQDPLLWGECLSGALYWNDFHNLAKKAGFGDPRVVESRPLSIEDEHIEHVLQGYAFFSATYRLWKLEGLESHCEDYGQAVRYKGTLQEQAQNFTLDDHHLFQKGKIVPVCGNTWRMLQETRYVPHFDFLGDFSTHYGIFEGCGTSLPFQRETTSTQSSCC